MKADWNVVSVTSILLTPVRFWPQPCVSLGGGSLSSAQDFHQFSSSSRLERDHDRGGDDHSGEERKERHRRPAVQEDEDEEDDEKEEDKDEEEEEEEEEDSKYHKPPALTPADGPLAGSQGQDRSEGNSSPFENKVTISTFGSIMRITSSSGLGSSSKIRKISSSGDYKPSKSLCKPSQLSTPPILEEADLEDKATAPPLPRERRHRGSKKSSHGPGRPRGSKNRERREEEHQHHHHHAAPPPPPALTSSLYPNPSSIPHPAFSSTLPPATISSSSFSSSSAGSFSTSRGNSLLGSGESMSVGVSVVALELPVCESRRVLKKKKKRRHYHYLFALQCVHLQVDCKVSKCFHCTCALSAAQQQLICISGPVGVVKQASGSQSHAGQIKILLQATGFNTHGFEIENIL